MRIGFTFTRRHFHDAYSGESCNCSTEECCNSRYLGRSSIREYSWKHERTSARSVQIQICSLIYTHSVPATMRYSNAVASCKCRRIIHSCMRHTRVAQWNSLLIRSDISVRRRRDWRECDTELNKGGPYRLPVNCRQRRSLHIRERHRLRYARTVLPYLK